MTSRILHTSYVINFLNIDFDSNYISSILKSELDDILAKNDIKELRGWELQFRATYGRLDKIKVFTKMPSYKNEKQKLIVIHIPIPTRDLIDWGVEENQHITVGSNPNEDRNNLVIDVDYSQYSNRQDYIFACLRRGIKKSLEEGFTVGGIKVKINEVSI